MSNKPTSTKQKKNKRGISHVISTIIVSASLLIILVSTAYISTNILNAQMASTEFEQAQSTMLLLDSTIQDIALRPGAGGYVQFNEREGGIGVNQTTNTLSIYATDGTDIESATFNNLVQLIYSGGSLASAAVDTSTGIQPLRGGNYGYVNQTEGLGFLRLAQDNGAKIKLDYDRVRIVSAGLVDSLGTNLVQITFIHLEIGQISGLASGTVNFMVRNNQTETETWQFESTNINITIQPYDSTYVVTPPEGAHRTAIVLSEINVEVSII